MNIYVASDHMGFELKKQVIDYLNKLGYMAEDAGDREYDANDDFPIFATSAVVKMLSSDDKNARAILICGSGQGMLMAANRFKGVRAGLGWSVEASRGIRNDEDSNVLAIPSRHLDSQEKWQPVVDAWLNTPFAGAPRYVRRNNELDQL
jgi:ribose 5-phosphate isomerase B